LVEYFQPNTAQCGSRTSNNGGVWANLNHGIASNGAY
jgi:hypothetical protein